MTSTQPDRQTLRRELLAQREHFMAGPAAAGATAELSRHLRALLKTLQPECLGLYWPQRSEFNAVPALRADPALARLPIALPFAQRAPVRMHYRGWDGRPPTSTDDCGIPCSDGMAVVPDVVVVPCVGFTAAGLRLGYGGGYFDRWLAEHRHVTAIGVAWSGSAIEADLFDAQAHDLALALIVTEHGVA